MKAVFDNGEYSFLKTALKKEEEAIFLVVATAYIN